MQLGCHMACSPTWNWGTRRWRRFFYDGEVFIARLYHPLRSQDSRDFPVEMKPNKANCLPIDCISFFGWSFTWFNWECMNSCAVNCLHHLAPLNVCVVLGLHLCQSLSSPERSIGWSFHSQRLMLPNRPGTTTKMFSLWRILQRARRVSSSMIGIPTSQRELHNWVLDNVHMLTPEPVEFKKLLKFWHEYGCRWRPKLPVIPSC